MKARLRIAGQPVHHMLAVFPLGLLATSFFFDVAFLTTARGELGIVAWWMIFAGVIGAIAASLFGLVDWLAIPRGTRAWILGAWHGGATTLVALLFAASWLLRRDQPAHPEWLAIGLSGGGVLLTVLTGWLGGELADRMEEV